mgnify:CR=1 FL=1
MCANCCRPFRCSSVDQEGGLVDRLRKIFYAHAVRQDDSRARRSGGVRARWAGSLAKRSRLLGFNMNFAPVMSIMTDERDLLSNGLYSRSFGRSPGEVLGYTTVYLRGLQETGIVGCLKHFPGIGAGEVDSHEQMPMVQSVTHDDLMAPGPRALHRTLSTQGRSRALRDGEPRRLSEHRHHQRVLRAACWSRRRSAATSSRTCCAVNSLINIWS